MPHVVTLIAGRELDDLAGRAATLARRLDADTVWLDPGRAVDLVVGGERVEESRAATEEIVGTLPVDRAVQPLFGRRKRLLVADMDSTVITVECVDVLARRTGLGETIAEITAQTIRGELEFGESLRRRVAMLKGTPVAALEAAWRDDVRLTEGAAALVATMRAHGALTALVSGGFTWFTSRVAAAAGFDLERANTLAIKADRLTGGLVEPVLDRTAKLAMLRELAASRGLALAETMAVGDGANDVAILEAAGTGVAFRAVPLAEAAADVAIRHNDLTALLFVQGYRRDDFVEAVPIP